MKGINRLASFIKADHRYVYLGTSVSRRSVWRLASATQRR